MSLVYDDVVQENPILKGFPVFDLELVEMFRGPQGTLFGRNTPAGVVKFDSVRPSQERDGYVQASYGTQNSINVEGAVGGALSRHLVDAPLRHLPAPRRLGRQHVHRRRRRSSRATTRCAGRVQFLYDSATDCRALFNVHARSLDGTARLFRANIFEPGTNDLVPGFSENQVAHRRRERPGPRLGRRQPAHLAATSTA